MQIHEGDLSINLLAALRCPADPGYPRATIVFDVAGIGMECALHESYGFAGACSQVSFFVVTSVLDCKMPLFQVRFLFSRFTCKSANRGVVPLLSIVQHADVRVTVCGRKV